MTTDVPAAYRRMNVGVVVLRCSEAFREVHTMKLRISLLTFAAGIALTAGSAAARRISSSRSARIPGSPGRATRISPQSHDLSGQTLSIFGPWLGPDKDLVESMLAYFEAATGATVEYAGSDSFEQQIVIDTQAGSPPNIAVFPQPGLAADLASKGDLTPLGDDVKNWLVDNYAAGQSWVDLSTYKGKDGEKHLYAFPYKADLKSLVWYVPENFEDAGYEVPRPWKS